jgi:hypothetical protein
MRATPARPAPLATIETHGIGAAGRAAAACAAPAAGARTAACCCLQGRSSVSAGMAGQDQTARTEVRVVSASYCTACGLLSATYCLRLAVCNLLPAAFCLLHTACCLLVQSCCTNFSRSFLTNVWVQSDFYEFKYNQDKFSFQQPMEYTHIAKHFSNFCSSYFYQLGNHALHEI